MLIRGFWRLIRVLAVCLVLLLLPALLLPLHWRRPIAELHSRTMLRQVRTLFLVLLASLTFITFVAAQCPALSGPCRCAPSIYEPVAIICENAGSLSNALQAIQPARDVSVSLS